ncbi:MAG TPA: hypothetical protein PK395_16865, partial [bacterium]|nr:hypothetical protein [bacterium]HQQ00987.1 hypothetical protein [bacterium]
MRSTRGNSVPTEESGISTVLPPENWPKPGVAHGNNNAAHTAIPANNVVQIRMSWDWVSIGYPFLQKGVLCLLAFLRGSSRPRLESVRKYLLSFWDVNTVDTMLKAGSEREEEYLL